MIVLMPGEGQAEPLDRIGDEAGRNVIGDAVEGLENGLHVVAGEIGHQRPERRVVELLYDLAYAGITVEIAAQMLAPALAALIDECRVERVRAGVDPVAQMLAVRPREGRLQPLAVFQRDDAPAHHAEQRIDAVEQPVADDGVEALAVVVDHPPQVADVVLPAFEQRFEDIALVELGVADQRDHPAGRLVGRQTLEADIVLYQGAEQRNADTEPDRTGRVVDIVTVLGARRIGLRAAERPETLQLVERLIAEQVLDGVEDRRGVRLDRDAVLRAQDVEIERRHQGDERGARGLVAADLEPVAARPQMVGVVDHPGGKPQHLALQGGEAAQPVGARLGGRVAPLDDAQLGHGVLVPLAAYQIRDDAAAQARWLVNRHGGAARHRLRTFSPLDCTIS